MWWLLNATVLAALVTLTASRRCCPGDEVYQANARRCSVTSDHLALNCSKYLLDPRNDKDNFTVMSDGQLKNGDSYIPAARFCVTRMIDRSNKLLDAEVALVCFPSLNDDTSVALINKKSHHTLMGVLMLISVIFMMATLLVYALLPDMCDLETKCLVSAVFNLCVAFLLLGVLQFAGGTLDSRSCFVTATFLYFWMLAAFFWLNVVAYNMWRTVVCEPSPDAALYVKYRVYAWGGPLLFVFIAMLVELLPRQMTSDLIRPEFAHSSCWFNDSTAIWCYFYGPVAILIAANLVLFVWTAVKLWRDDATQSSHVHSLRFKCVLYVKLFVIVGITWIFELLSHLHDRNNLTGVWLVTDIINALQGVLIFIVTVVCRRRVLRGLAEHRVCGISWPRSWMAGVDAESHAILATADVEMAPAADKILS